MPQEDVRKQEETRESPRVFETLQVPILEKKGALWTLRKRVQLAWDMSRNTELARYWRGYTAQERVTAFINEGVRLWDHVTDQNQTLKSQLEYAQRMELAFYMARMLAGTNRTIAYSTWAPKVRIYLERQARVLGSLATMKGSARPVYEFEERPW